MRNTTLLLLIILSFAFAPRMGLAATGKEFTTSVVYGTLAGTLVGAATLAFTSNPGDNLNNVARGASYGLYTGILLGLYVTYGLGDSKPESEEELRLEQGPIEDDGSPKLEDIEKQKVAPDVQYVPPTKDRLRAHVFPLIISEKKFTSVGAGLALTF